MICSFHKKATTTTNIKIGCSMFLLLFYSVVCRVIRNTWSNCDSTPSQLHWHTWHSPQYNLAMQIKGDIETWTSERLTHQRPWSVLDLDIRENDTGQYMQGKLPWSYQSILDGYRRKWEGAGWHNLQWSSDDWRRLNRICVRPVSEYVNILILHFDCRNSIFVSKY